MGGQMVGGMGVGGGVGIGGGQGQGGGHGGTPQGQARETAPQQLTVLAALDKEAEKGKASINRLKKEFMWQQEYGSGKASDTKLDIITPQLGIRPYGLVQKTSL